MPFISFRPITCVLLTFPKMSTSMAVLTEMMPSRRMISGLLLISCGRSTTRERKNFRLSYTRFSAGGVTVNEQLLANVTRPRSSRSTTESCSTSVYISNGGIPGWLPSAPRTELAMSPTPD